METYYCSPQEVLCTENEVGSYYDYPAIIFAAIFVAGFATVAIVVLLHVLLLLASRETLH